MAKPRFGTPWWADIAIQGHALGLFLGIAAGVLLFRRRRAVGRPAVLWLAALVFAVDKGLWAVYTFLGNNRFELFRAAGVGLAFVLAAMVAAGLTASERELVPSIELRYNEIAVGLLLATLVALAAVAVPFNLNAVGDPGRGVTEGNSVEVRDYTVFYEEDVPNQLVSAVDVPGLEGTAEFNDSGVIVVSERRNIWWEVYGKRELAFGGDRYVRLGGIGWRRTVRANRTGWSVAGGGAAYRIRLKRTGANEPWTLAHVAPPARAGPRIEGKNVSIAATRRGFDVVVSRNNTTLDRTPVPTGNQSVRLGGINLTRVDRELVASTANGTRVTVAKRESYKR